MKKRVTMKEVADLAGVTIGTVSNVINHKAVVLPQTVQKVQEAIRTLEYVPNSAARNMRLGHNRQIGMLIPNLTNNFYSGIISRFVDLADREGYTVLILGYEYSPEREKKALRSLYENNVQTIVVINGTEDEKWIRQYMSRGITFVLGDRHCDSLPGVSYVEFENKTVVADAVGYLKKRGYRRIGYLSEPLSITNIADRYEGFLRGMKLHGYLFRPEDVYISERLCLDNTQNGYMFMKEVLQRRSRDDLPDAFIISSDLQAIGVMRAIREAGYSIPRDFGIIGCDNLELSGYVDPGLTTIDQDRDMLGRKLWEMTKRRMAGIDTENIVLEQRLIIRESC